MLMGLVVGLVAEREEVVSEMPSRDATHAPRHAKEPDAHREEGAGGRGRRRDKGLKGNQAFDDEQSASGAEGSGAGGRRKRRRKRKQTSSSPPGNESDPDVKASPESNDQAQEDEQPGELVHEQEGFDDRPERRIVGSSAGGRRRREKGKELCAPPLKVSRKVARLEERVRLLRQQVALQEKEEEEAEETTWT